MKTVLIVPAYRPTEDMLPMLERFLANGEYDIVVVNDGSGEQYDPIFAQVPEACTLLVHPQNKGKGAALKTAMNYILENMPECEVAVTADADGQHHYEDILRVVETARKERDVLVLGSRAFDGDVPFRSRFGNSVTRTVFKLASGVRVYDTQTGLRAFSRSAMEKFAQIPGERYEYEINMLLYASREKIVIREETIKTVYLDDNSASSFNPLRDSIKIYKCIFRFVLQRLVRFAKFISTSIASFVLDVLLLLLFNYLFIGMGEVTALYLSVGLARVCSATLNFVLNKRMVFKSREKWWKEVWQYALLAICILVAKTYLMKFLTITLGWPLLPSDMLVEVVLFLLSYLIQGRFVFKKTDDKQN